MNTTSLAWPPPLPWRRWWCEDLKHGFLLPWSQRNPSDKVQSHNVNIRPLPVLLVSPDASCYTTHNDLHRMYSNQVKKRFVSDSEEQIYQVSGDLISNQLNQHVSEQHNPLKNYWQTNGNMYEMLDLNQGLQVKAISQQSEDQTQGHIKQSLHTHPLVSCRSLYHSFLLLFHHE